MRIQHLYESGEFTRQDITYPIVITGARWRSAPGLISTSWSGGSYANVEICLGSAARAASAPSSNFATNRAGDHTLVYDGTVPYLPGTGNGTGIPGPVVVEVAFETPFTYDPTAGRDFLWEVSYPTGSWSGGTTSIGDFFSISAGSRVWNNTGPAAISGGIGTFRAMAVELLYERRGIDEGPLVGLPVTLTARSSSLPLSGRMLQKKSGYAPLADVAPPAGRPDLRHDVVFALGGPPGSVEVDALSLGLDMVLADEATGRSTLPPGAWGAVLFSVDGVQGTPTEVIRRELGAADGVAGDIFTHMIPGSSLPSIYANRTTRAMDSTELGLYDAATATRGAVETIDGLAHLYELDADLVATLPSQPTVYFSLDPSTVLAYAAAPFWSGTLPSPGTILQRTWLGSSWGPVSVFRAYDQLGLVIQDDIDALGVDEASCKLLFSITTSSPSALNFSQLRLYAWCLDGGTDYVGDYLVADGSATVASSMGTGESSTGLGPKTNVTSLCPEDPGRGWSLLPATQGNYLPFSTGQPLAPLPIEGFPPRLSSSLFRTCTRAGTPAIMTAMVGWPSPNTVRADGIAIFFIYLPGTAPYPILSVARSSSPTWPLAGAPITLEFPLPDTTLLGVEIDGWWVAASLSGELAQSPPVRLAL
ncbi:MAG: hypothetical protein IPN34_12905 [Planctomycetes bacterium]|nr:hypothetical protein [Planctomycetota bacterium]